MYSAYEFLYTIVNGQESVECLNRPPFKVRTLFNEPRPGVETVVAAREQLDNLSAIVRREKNSSKSGSLP